MKTAIEPIGAKLLCMKKPIISCAGNGSLEGVPNVSHDFIVGMDITPKSKVVSAVLYSDPYCENISVQQEFF